jgi:SAM-dependent methyltransferase
MGTPPAATRSGGDDAMTAEDLRRQIDALGPWFYPFDFGHGAHTRSFLPDAVLPIFSTRLEMLTVALHAHFGARLPDIEGLDVGCHEGFYTIALARLGLRRVVGFDVRDENLRKARFAAGALGHPEIAFVQGDLENADAGAIGVYDLTVLFGVLYHLPNPMRCLRRVAAMTRELLILETQVVPDVARATEWGARNWRQPYRGVLALVDESGEFETGGAETGVSPLVCCPSPRAVEAMLKGAGFRGVEIIPPPRGAYEQHRRGKRLVFKAWK